MTNPKKVIFHKGVDIMSTKANYKTEEIGTGKIGFSKTRSIIETAFYGNNVVPVNTLKEAYNLAKNSPGTIVTDMPVYRGEEFGLEPDAKVLLFNDGAITGRYATARRIAGEPGVDCEALDKVVMDAVYSARWKKLYHATCYAGLDKEFMVKVHLLIPVKRHICLGVLYDIAYRVENATVCQFHVGISPIVCVTFRNAQGICHLCAVHCQRIGDVAG